ncbi:ABC transporter permease [Hutsoniella sourekii]
MTQLSLIQQILQYYEENTAYLIAQFIQHLLMAVYGTLFSALLAVPLGFYIAKRPKLSQYVIGLANVIQTVPSLALLSVVMLVMGLGSNLVVLTIFLYSLLPILRNTVAGVNNVPADLIDVGRGMGMTKWQVIRKVELPLAMPVIMGGLRTAFITAIGIATIGTFVGAGGLGSVLTRGINASDASSIIIAGVIPIALMSITADWLLAKVEKQFLPRSH